MVPFIQVVRMNDERVLTHHCTHYYYQLLLLDQRRIPNPLTHFAELKTFLYDTD